MKILCFVLVLSFSVPLAPLFAQSEGAAKTESSVTQGNEANNESGVTQGNEAVKETDFHLSQTETEGGANDAEREASLSGTGSIWTVLRAIIVLIVIALAIYGCIYFIKKNRAREITKNNFLKLLAIIPLNTRNAAAVVSLGGRAWLLGLADSSVTPIAELNDKELIDSMILEYERSAATVSSSFLKILSRFIPPNKGASDKSSRQEAAKQESADRTEAASNLREIHNRLKNL